MIKFFSYGRIFFYQLDANTEFVYNLLLSFGDMN